MHIRYFIGYVYHICLQDNTIVVSSLPSYVVAHATATSAPDPTVWFHRSLGSLLKIIGECITPYLLTR